MAEKLKLVSFVLTGLLLTSFGLRILATQDLTFGGTAGLATVLTFISPWSWGVLFFLINIPFFWISIKKLGVWFTVSSFMSIIGISLIRDSLDYVQIQTLPVLLVAIIAGLCIGFGVTLVLNNGSSLGGIHILALYADQRWGLNRGLVIFISDLLIIILAGLLAGWGQAIISIFVIFIASMIIGRYKKSPIKEGPSIEKQPAYTHKHSQSL
ncbi:YitT family protein [Bacillus suaedae]|uniref:YitT family protein n=1 Tax=Halalkalibacter suaedae TaxID=2822140 RepID=A0A940WUR8_9BACI|nr:YitT family protein [Bacillus suaedae]MBP3950643.1 YitT family protein [Bacillus suaedae]